MRATSASQHLPFLERPPYAIRVAVPHVIRAEDVVSALARVRSAWLPRLRERARPRPPPETLRVRARWPRSGQPTILPVMAEGSRSQAGAQMYGQGGGHVLAQRKRLPQRRVARGKSCSARELHPALSWPLAPAAGNAELLAGAAIALNDLCARESAHICAVPMTVSQDADLRRAVIRHLHPGYCSAAAL